MLRSKRINLIRDYVIKNGTVSIDELVSEFKVSKNTIRRDIHLLVENGELKKVYGGVEVNPDISKSTVPIQLKDELLIDDEIARAAANFVENGDIIFIDSEAATVNMISYLGDKTITVITNSVEFITKSLPYEQMNVISIGGVLDRKSKTFRALNLQEFLKDLNVNKAFFAPLGISLSKGVTHSSPFESELKQMIINKNPEVYLLVDYYRFDKSSLMTFCYLDAVDYIITDYSPDERYLKFIQEYEIHLVAAKE